MSDLTRRIEAEKRQLLSMKQHKDALASGGMTAADIERMAIDRVRTGRTSGRRPSTASANTARDEPELEYLGTYIRDERVGLFDADPWLITRWQEPTPGVDDEPSDLPPRQYEAYLIERGGRRYVCIALDWKPL